MRDSERVAQDPFATWVCRLILHRLPRIHLDQTSSADFSLIRFRRMHLSRFVEYVCGVGQTFDDGTLRDIPLVLVPAGHHGDDQRDDEGGHLARS